MGACEFVNEGMGKYSKDVFSRIVLSATHEYGHDSYNGTISTCDSYKMVELPSRRNVKKFIENRLEKMDKWDCECIELPKTATSKWKAEHNLKGKKGKVFVFYGVAAY